MIIVNIRTDISKAMKYMVDLPQKIQDQAVAAAINKTIDKARAEMTRQITAEYNVKASDVRPQLSIGKASAKNGKLAATLEAFGRRRGHRSRNVMLFDAREVKGKGQPRKVRVRFPNGDWRTIIVRAGGGVSVKIKRNGGRKLIKDAFIGNKGRTVFRRDGDKIKAVETVDVPGMFNTRSVNAAVMNKIRVEFPIELQRSVNRFIKD